MKQLSSQNESDRKLKSYKIVSTIHRTGSSNVLHRVAHGDRAAIQDCIDIYGSLIWSLSKNLTGSVEDAEAVTREIFLNIWRYAPNFEKTDFDELVFITLIARRQLKKYSEEPNHSIN
jgi:DNA-directed RNA polymerase specialized sigma24 family protein